jgi:hypothetical protein
MEHNRDERASGDTHLRSEQSREMARFLVAQESQKY